MTRAIDRQDDYRTARRLLDLERAVRQIPAKFTRGGSVNELRIIIIGGNTVSGIDCIAYAASVTAGAVYDPNVTAVYPTGMGRGWLYLNGSNQGRVLVRHNLASYSGPIISGERVVATGTTTVTYSGTAMTCYTLDWY